MRVAFIGLGVMGFPMAGHLSRRGHDVTVFNRTTARAARWCREYAGAQARTPAAAADRADIVMTCVGNDDDVREVLTGPAGAMSAAMPGTIFIDHTTTSAELARELSQVASDNECQFLDAPVSGGQAGAERGELTVMVGGDRASLESARSALDAYARAVTHVGPSGSGQLAKMVNQICIAGLLQGLSEGLHFALRAGIEPAVVIDAISKGAAQSWQMENRWENMVAGEFEFGFAVDWMRKDLGIALDEAGRIGASLELTALVDRYYGEIQEMGGHRWDTSSLIARLERDD